jgi:hypothetical protein
MINTPAYRQICHSCETCPRENGEQESSFLSTACLGVAIGEAGC